MSLFAPSFPFLPSLSSPPNKQYRSTAAAQQRIDKWLRELDSREPSSATVADSVSPIVETQPAAVVSVPVTSEVEAPPVEAPPAAVAPSEAGYKVCGDEEATLYV